MLTTALEYRNLGYFLWHFHCTASKNRQIQHTRGCSKPTKLLPGFSRNVDKVHSMNKYENDKLKITIVNDRRGTMDLQLIGTECIHHSALFFVRRGADQKPLFWEDGVHIENTLVMNTKHVLNGSTSAYFHFFFKSNSCNYFPTD